jgi:hypothetical protein
MLAKATRNKLYFVWRMMVKRCRDSEDPRFPRYGGRGIEVCDRWADSFDAFIADMGATYRDGLTLERQRNGEGYSPNNCCWATRFEQQANTRKTVLLTHDGQSLPLREWSRRTGVHVSVIARRLKKGLPPAECLRRAG